MKNTEKKVQNNVPSLGSEIAVSFGRTKTALRKMAANVIRCGDHFESLAAALFLNKIDECFGADMASAAFITTKIKRAEWEYVEFLAKEFHATAEEIVSAIVVREVVINVPDCI